MSGAAFSSGHRRARIEVLNGENVALFECKLCGIFWYVVLESCECESAERDVSAVCPEWYQRQVSTGLGLTLTRMLRR